jgi:demethylmenaquinone methyltransferase/2-methoxy-6-polyprenyl-1,4-benzoquinol methylase
MKDYYDTRAPEYDEWYRGTGLFAQRERPGWQEALDDLIETIKRLNPASTLDVACGTGFLTRHIPGDVTGVDQSARMLEQARVQAPSAHFIQADALRLPFEDKQFERVFTGHFYGHLDQRERGDFLAQARRVAPELIVVDSAIQPGHETEEVQERTLNDGSRFTVYKRYFDAGELAQELGGGEVLHESQWFVAVRSRV